MQGYEWGEFKRNTGWRVQRVGLEKKGQLIAGAQLLFRSLPGVPFTLAYLSKGPLLNYDDKVVATQLWSLIHQAAHHQQAIFLMAEPNWLDTGPAHQHLYQQGFNPSTHTNHPHSTIIVDLSPAETVILKAIRKKTRQLIRKAERNGVEIVSGTVRDLAQFQAVLESTADIKDIPAHDLDFYHQVWNVYAPLDKVRLLLAKHNDQVVAAKMVFLFGNRSLHLWGGTTAKGRKLNASYLIQWETLKWAKQQGCLQADLWGIPDEVGQLLKQGEDIPKTNRTGLWGVYLFKRGFGGTVESYVGTYDYVYRPNLYRLAHQFRRFSVDTLSVWLERIRNWK